VLLLQAAEMFFFAILMFVTMIVFGIMALFYKYVTPPEPITPAEYDETTSLAPLAAASANNGAASNTTSDQT
jgi:hypothetical protein